MGPVPTTAAPARPDATCAAAVDLAAAAAREVAGDSVGPHLGAQADGDRVVTHLFASDQPGYTGWQWAVTVARASRSRHVTVDEVVLLPGEDALLPPEWVPWSERLRPGDLGVGDLLPTPSDDDRLVPGVPAVRRPGRRGGRVRAGSGPAAGAVVAGPGGDGRAVVRRGRRTGQPDVGARAGPLRHVRLLPAGRRLAAGALRRVRQPVLAAGRAGGVGRLRVRRPLRGTGRAARRPPRRRRRPTTTRCWRSSRTWPRRSRHRPETPRPPRTPSPLGTAEP